MIGPTPKINKTIFAEFLLGSVLLFDSKDCETLFLDFLAIPNFIINSFLMEFFSFSFFKLINLGSSRNV